MLQLFVELLINNMIDFSVINIVCFGSDELKAMLDERWSNRKVPLLVLCLKTNNPTTTSLSDDVSSIVVANKLNLRSLSRPWQVY